MCNPNNTCETCKYGCFGRFREPDKYGSDEEALHCRKNAPQHVSGTGTGYDNSLFPCVDKSFWCGEYISSDCANDPPHNRDHFSVGDKVFVLHDEETPIDTVTEVSNDGKVIILAHGHNLYGGSVTFSAFSPCELQRLYKDELK